MDTADYPAAEMLADRVLCAVNNVLFTPALFKVSLFQRAKMCLETGPPGF